MKWIWRTLAVIVVLLVAAFFFLRTPDTDPDEMRAKYGGEPSQFVRIGDELEFHLRDEGPRDSPAIVLLHGSNADVYTWQPWVDALKEDYRVIRYDQRGHGLTGAADSNDYSLAAFVSDLEAVRAHLELDSFVLGGNSMGGWIAAGYAMEHPENLAGLVLVDAGGAPQLEETEGNIGFTIAQTPGLSWFITQITPRSMVRDSLSQSVSNQDIVTEEAVDRYWELLRYPGNRQATVTRFGKPRTPYTEQEVAAIEVPTLVMWGEEDTLISQAAAHWYDGLLPNSELVTYPGIGHLPMEEHAEQSVQDLRDWLASLATIGAEAEADEGT